MKRFLVLLLVPLFSFSQNKIEAFIPEIVSQFLNVRDIAISPNGNEIMFSAQSVMANLSAIISISKNKDDWGTPKIVSFSGQYFDIEPFFSRDGLKLYYASNRPMDNVSNKTKDFDIWYVERKTLKDNWSKPINMGAPINTKDDEFYPSIADNGNLYFTLDKKELNRKDDIYVSKFKNGKYTTPIVLNGNINTTGYEFNAFIAPDESYIIYTCYNRKGGLGSGDLYISYKTEDDWTPSKNIGSAINTTKMDYCPFVDSKNQTLYFTSKLDNTKTILEQPHSIESLKKAFFKYDNGLSRLYKVSFNLIQK